MCIYLAGQCFHTLDNIIHHSINKVKKIAAFFAKKRKIQANREVCKTIKKASCHLTVQKVGTAFLHPINYGLAYGICFLLITYY